MWARGRIYVSFKKTFLRYNSLPLIICHKICNKTEHSIFTFPFKKNKLKDFTIIHFEKKKMNTTFKGKKRENF